mgnify:FL=1
MALTITETGFDMGLGEHRSWHLDEHVHVAFGTLAKLREEVMEYQEACRQQLPMAALFEFSDIIGALAGHLRSVGVTSIDMPGPADTGAAGVWTGFYLYAELARPEEWPKLARWLLSAIGRAAAVYNMTLEDLLRQAQLRSAVLLNGSSTCSA